MEEAPAFSVENFIDNWNGHFTDYPLTVEDLKNSTKFIGAVLHIYNRLGIEEEAILQAPPEDESNKHVIYYSDLIPVINATRIFNHLASVIDQAGPIGIKCFLQPTVNTSVFILLLLFNLLSFNEERLNDIAPYEIEMSSKTDEINALEDKKNRLLESLNTQAREKATRAQTMEKLNADIRQFEKELKQETASHDEEKKELDAILYENKQLEIQFEKKKAHRDAIIAEVEKLKAQRVYDADDIKKQAETAEHNVRKADEKLDSLKKALMEKESCLKNLQAIKPNLDTAIEIMHEIMELSESTKDEEPDDLDLDTKDGELEVLNNDVKELEVQLAEVRVAREQAEEKRKVNGEKRQQESAAERKKLAEAEGKERIRCEETKKTLQRIEEIKQLTLKYEKQKLQGMEELARIKEKFTYDLNSMEDGMMNQMSEAKKNIEEKLRKRKENKKYLN